MISLVILAFAVTACNANHFQRIVNGKDTDISQHPWQLSLQYNGSHTCGAVLIRSDIALTAAHCVQRPHEYFTVVAGVTYLSDSSKMTFEIEAIKSHEQYSGTGLGFPNDIAILFLKESLPLSNSISIIDLNSETDVVGRACSITGWGRLYADSPLPNMLQEAPTSIISHSECFPYFGILGFLQVNDDIHVCVYTNINGACNGDSGGPLVCKDNGISKLVGLTSWGKVDCPVNSPSVYTRVSNYVGWIHEKVLQHDNI